MSIIHSVHALKVPHLRLGHWRQVHVQRVRVGARHEAVSEHLGSP